MPTWPGTRKTFRMKIITDIADGGSKAEKTKKKPVNEKALFFLLKMICLKVMNRRKGQEHLQVKKTSSCE